MYPQLEIGVSTAFLQKTIQNLIPAQIPCPDPTRPNDQFITDLIITEVVTLRGDESQAKDASGKTAKDALTILGNNFNFYTIRNAYIVNEVFAPIGDQFLAPRAFLLVSCSFRVLTLGKLGAEHTSEADSIVRQAFDRQSGLGPLLFSVDFWSTPDYKGVYLQIAFQTLFNSNIDMATKAFYDPIQMLRSQFGQKNILLPVDGLLQILTPGGVTKIGINTGITAYPWPSASTPPTAGLRAALDFDDATDSIGWKKFFNVDPSHPSLLDTVADTSQDLSIALDSDFLRNVLTQIMRSATATQVFGGFIQFRFDTPHVNLGDQVVQIAIPLVSGDISGGNVYVNITPSVNIDQYATPTSSFLDLKACARFDVNIGTEILLWFLGTFLGAIAGSIAGPWGMLAGGLIVGIAGAVAEAEIPSITKGIVNSQFGTLSLAPLTCGAVDQNSCRVCSQLTDLDVPTLGRIYLTNFKVSELGIGAMFSLASRTGVSGPAKLNVMPSNSWEYPFKRCEGSSPDPFKRVALTNVGGLPLEICLIDQDTHDGNEPGVLTVEPLVDDAVPKKMLQPGESFPVTVSAVITGNTSYDQAQPPPLWLRIVTTSGAIEINLNDPSPARSQDPAQMDRLAAIARLVCDLRTIAPPHPIWRRITYTDPAPFTPADQVVERLDLVYSTGENVSLEGYDGQGRVIGRSFVDSGRLVLNMTNARAPSSSHVHLSMAYGWKIGAEGTESVAVKANFSISSKETERQATSIMERSLYRRQRIFQMRTAIIASAKLNNALVLLTTGDVRIAPVTINGIRGWKATAVPGACALDASGNRIAICHAAGVTIFDQELHVQNRFELDALAVALIDDHLWLAAARELISLEINPEQGVASTEGNILLPGIEDLVAAGGVLFARVGEHVWVIDGALPRLLHVAGERLVKYGEHAGIIADGVLTLINRDGRAIQIYDPVPWLANVHDWSGIAAEIGRSQGTVTIYERYETPIDVVNLKTWLDNSFR